FVFPREQYVTDPSLGERRRRPPSSAVKHRNIAEDRPHELLRSGLISFPAFEGVSPSRQVIPACPARRLGIRRNDFDTWFSQVVPILHLLWISLPYQEHDRRSVRRPVVSQPRLPLLGHEPGLLSDH